ncbi:MAG: hypothetical protein COB53_13165 [Elusimicrobia bacterium]|nr:MAG: hypothetical protein COB53_13165 [Elusimicrobiota bacterium]
MSDHPSFEDLSAHFDGEATGLAPHLQSCTRCREVVASLEADRAAIKGAWTTPAMPGTLSDLIPESTPWWSRLVVGWRVPVLALTAACVALLLWNQREMPVQPRLEIPLELFIAAHNQYELTLPLAPTERILTEMPRGLAVSFEHGQEKKNDVY